MLDRVNGEEIGDLGRHFLIVPLAKWSDTPLWQDACRRAQHALVKKGALLPIVFDEQSVLIQEYPTQARILFLFARKVAGKWVYVPVVMALSDETIAWLKMSGRWAHSGSVH